MKLSVIITLFNQENLVLRALDSIPPRNDIEIIVVDDGSSDNSVGSVRDWMNRHPDMNVILYEIGEDIGVGKARNIGMDLATGEYVHHLDSDDWLITDKYEMVLDSLDTDIVYINLVINNGDVFVLSPDTKHIFCAFTTKFMRRSLIGDTRCPPKRHAEDWYFNEEIQKKPHTERYSGIVCYHYNHPRKGSLCEEMSNGLHD